MRNDSDNDFAENLALGDRLRESSKLEEALAAYEQASKRNPEAPDGYCRRASVLIGLGRKEGAEECYRQALECCRGYPDAALGLGSLLAQRAAWGEAEAAFRKGLAEFPDHLDLHVGLGDLLVKMNRNTEACYLLRRAVAIQPDSVVALNGLGVVLRCLGRNDEAADCLTKAVGIDDKASPAWTNLAICHLRSGKPLQAEAAYRKAIKEDPSYWNAWDGLLLMSNYLCRDRGEVFDLHRAYGALCPPSDCRFENVPDKDRRLRIGFVSSDFRQHSVSYFILAVLEKLDRGRFELWGYFSYPNPDHRTEAFRQLFYAWRPVYGRMDAEVAEQVRADRIDILIDLSGHTVYNRLGVFVRKPAPVQLSWIGYPNTTGLAQIDYRITDAYADPEGEADPYFVERLWRLPQSFLCYTPPAVAPEVVEAPCLKRGYVTFGSFSTRMKIGSECLALWSKVLQAVPESRLLLKSALGLDEAGARETLRAQFVEYGIAADRVEISAPKGLLEDHLTTYGEIDIALDTVPYHGTTTTCEALWMGVPVVSLAGDRHVSRVGVSLLSNAGLSDLIAASEDEYVEIAAQLASDFHSLGLIRGALRDVLKNSRLLDEAAMTCDFSAALRSMWREYCEEQPERAADEALPATECPAGDSPRRLLIGATEAADGWQVFAAKPGEGVDFDGDLGNLSRFGDEEFSEVYCAHVVQRLGVADVADYLKNLRRILMPGGRLYLSVPDLDVLAWLLASPLYGKVEKFAIMRALYGGQTSAQDFNYVGLNFDFLCDYLRDAGFSSIEHVASFGLFADASESNVNSIATSLNLIAEK